ncbi:MAG: Crp/Fnr family transcriptional regulator [Thermodesulfobacteriota bacterium]
MNSYTVTNDVCEACEFQENLGVLREINFFAQMPMEMIKVFAYLCNREAYREGDVLFHEYEDIDRGMYIVTGKAGIFRAVDGKEKQVREYGPGVFLGGLALLGKLRQLYTLKATSELVCLIITREKFTLAMEQFPELKPKVLQAMIDRIRAWEERFLVEHGDACEKCIGRMGAILV